jgi:CelD/BcsL family acetyltransferase involved in cellulose biosynthesis
LKVWLDTIAAARGIEPVLVAVLGPGDTPFMLLALGIERRGPGRVLSFLDGGISDYNGPVLFPETPDLNTSEFMSLWRGILEKIPAFDLLELEKMPRAIGEKANPLLHLGAQRHAVSCHIANLPATWDEYASRLKPPVTFQRSGRALRKLGTLTYTPATDMAEAECLLDLMLAQKKRRFVETNAYGYDKFPGMEAFYRAATRAHLADGLVVIAAVRVGTQIIATQWSLRYGGRHYGLIAGHEAGPWSKFSPGRVLNTEMLRWCIENGLSIADFGIGDEGYKFEFCDEHIEILQVERPRTAKGRAYILAREARLRVRKTRLWQALKPYKDRIARVLGKKS